MIVVEGSYLSRLTEQRKVLKVYGNGIGRNLKLASPAVFTDIL